MSAFSASSTPSSSIVSTIDSSSSSVTVWLSSSSLSLALVHSFCNALKGSEIGVSITIKKYIGPENNNANFNGSFFAIVFGKISPNISTRIVIIIVLSKFASPGSTISLENT